MKYKSKTIKNFRQINEIWKNRSKDNGNISYIYKENIDALLKIFLILIKTFFSIFKWFFLIWILIGISFFLYLSTQSTLNLNSIFSLYKISNISLYEVGGDIIDNGDIMENIDILVSIMSILASSMTIISVINDLTGGEYTSYNLLNFYWKVFAYPMALICDSIYFIIVGMTGIPMVKSIIFGFDNQETLWGLPTYYWYGFLISFIIITFLIFYQLLSIASKKDNERARVDKTKTLFLGIILIFSSIIFIPLLFIVVDSIVILIVGLILDTIDISLQTFSFSNVLFNLSFSDTELINSNVNSIPSEPIYLGEYLSADIFYHILFFAGISIITYYEFRLLIFIFVRVFNIMFILISNPIVNSFYIVDGGERFKIWLKKLLKEFFIITFIVLEFSVFILSFSVISFTFSQYVESFENIMKYILFMTFSITVFSISLKSENIMKTIFFRDIQKVEGKVITSTQEDYQKVKIDQETINSLKSISNSVKVNTSKIGHDIRNVNSTMRMSINTNKNINKEIIKINKKINRNLNDQKISKGNYE